jgi:hypothetical protein
MTAEGSKMTAQEMFKKVKQRAELWVERHRGHDFCGHIVINDLLVAHSAQQKVIDQQAGEIARLRGALELIAEDNFPDSPVAIARQALAGKEGL